MYINNVKTLVKAHTPEGIKNFGFTFEFENGLNILTGDNSSGKSTVLSCINYCLGLEQLIGSKGTNALSPALHQALNSGGQSHNIYESECFLNITGSNGKEYLLNRKIKQDNCLGSNEIIIESEGRKFSKFIHSHRDHSNQGFFKWLAEINQLEIFEVEASNADSIKPLYMQNVFTLSFVEQTKGWSELFSMMPPFGIKDPKQKVVEYCLGLNSLSVNMELDVIKIEKEKLSFLWRNTLEDILFRSQNIKLYLSHIDKKKPVAKRNIESLYLAEISSDSKEVTYGAIISKIKNNIELLNEKIKSHEPSMLRSMELLEDSNKIKQSLDRYTFEREEIANLCLEEVHKLSSYKKAISGIELDIQDFKDVNKISLDRNWSKISSAKCPVCESDVENKRDANLSAVSIERSLAFLKSQQSTYRKYISASENVIERYKSTLEYYDRTISLKREQLDSLYKDIKSPQFNSYRSDFETLAELKFRKGELEAFNEYFKNVKGTLVDYSREYYRLKSEEDRLKQLVSSDDEKVFYFKDSFISLLRRFGYRSNGLNSINIKNEGANRLLPSVFITGQEPQYIRFVSSASDFVRSIWAYYIALLIKGERHPGFLVMDEPGQHQMRVDSMKALLKECSSLNKQVIVAISQDRDYDQKNVNIHSLVSDIESESYKLLHIDDGTGCIAELKKGIV